MLGSPSNPNPPSQGFRQLAMDIYADLDAIEKSPSYSAMPPDDRTTVLNEWAKGAHLLPEDQAPFQQAASSVLSERNSQLRARMPVDPATGSLKDPPVSLGTIINSPVWQASPKEDRAAIMSQWTAETSEALSSAALRKEDALSAYAQVLQGSSLAAAETPEEAAKAADAEYLKESAADAAALKVKGFKMGRLKADPNEEGEGRFTVSPNLALGTFEEYSKAIDSDASASPVEKLRAKALYDNNRAAALGELVKTTQNAVSGFRIDWKNAIPSLSPAGPTKIDTVTIAGKEVDWDQVNEIAVTRQRIANYAEKGASQESLFSDNPAVRKEAEIRAAKQLATHVLPAIGADDVAKRILENPESPEAKALVEQQRDVLKQSLWVPMKGLKDNAFEKVRVLSDGSAAINPAWALTNPQDAEAVARAQGVSKGLGRIQEQVTETARKGAGNLIAFAEWEDGAEGLPSWVDYAAPSVAVANKYLTRALPEKFAKFVADKKQAGITDPLTIVGAYEKEFGFFDNVQIGLAQSASQVKQIGGGIAGILSLAGSDSLAKLAGDIMKDTAKEQQLQEQLTGPNSGIYSSAVQSITTELPFMAGGVVAGRLAAGARVAAEVVAQKTLVANAMRTASVISAEALEASMAEAAKAGSNILRAYGAAQASRSFGGMYQSAYLTQKETALRLGKTEEEADRSARLGAVVPAIAAGAGTYMLMKAFPGGTEAAIERMATGTPLKDVVSRVGKTNLLNALKDRKIVQATADLLRKHFPAPAAKRAGLVTVAGLLDEGAEEMADDLLQSAITNVFDETITLQKSLENAAHAGALGAWMGAVSSSMANVWDQRQKAAEWVTAKFKAKPLGTQAQAATDKLRSKGDTETADALEEVVLQSAPLSRALKALPAGTVFTPPDDAAAYDGLVHEVPDGADANTVLEEIRTALDGVEGVDVSLVDGNKRVLLRDTTDPTLGMTVFEKRKKWADDARAKMNALAAGGPNVTEEDQEKAKLALGNYMLASGGAAADAGKQGPLDSKLSNPQERSPLARIANMSRVGGRIGRAATRAEKPITSAAQVEDELKARLTAKEQALAKATPEKKADAQKAVDNARLDLEAWTAPENAQFHELAFQRATAQADTKTALNVQMEILRPYGDATAYEEAWGTKKDKAPSAPPATGTAPTAPPAPPATGTAPTAPPAPTAAPAAPRPEVKEADILAALMEAAKNVPGYAEASEDAKKLFHARLEKAAGEYAARYASAAAAVDAEQDAQKKGHREANLKALADALAKPGAGGVSKAIEKLRTKLGDPSLTTPANPLQESTLRSDVNATAPPKEKKPPVAKKQAKEKRDARKKGGEEKKAAEPPKAEAAPAPAEPTPAPAKKEAPKPAPKAKVKSPDEGGQAGRAPRKWLRRYAAAATPSDASAAVEKELLAIAKPGKDPVWKELSLATRNEISRVLYEADVEESTGPSHQRMQEAVEMMKDVLAYFGKRKVSLTEGDASDSFIASVVSAVSGMEDSTTVDAASLPDVAVPGPDNTKSTKGFTLKALQAEAITAKGENTAQKAFLSWAKSQGYGDFADDISTAAPEFAALWQTTAWFVRQFSAKAAASEEETEQDAEDVVMAEKFFAGLFDALVANKLKAALWKGKPEAKAKSAFVAAMLAPSGSDLGPGSKELTAYQNFFDRPWPSFRSALVFQGVQMRKNANANRIRRSLRDNPPEEENDSFWDPSKETRTPETSAEDQAANAQAFRDAVLEMGGDATDGTSMLEALAGSRGRYQAVAKILLASKVAAGTTVRVVEDPNGSPAYFSTVNGKPVITFNPLAKSVRGVKDDVIHEFLHALTDKLLGTTHPDGSPQANAVASLLDLQKKVRARVEAALDSWKDVVGEGEVPGTMQQSIEAHAESTPESVQREFLAGDPEYSPDMTAADVLELYFVRQMEASPITKLQEQISDFEYALGLNEGADFYPSGLSVEFVTHMMTDPWFMDAVDFVASGKEAKPLKAFDRFVRAIKLLVDPSRSSQVQYTLLRELIGDTEQATKPRGVSVVAGKAAEMAAAAAAKAKAFWSSSTAPTPTPEPTPTPTPTPTPEPEAVEVAEIPAEEEAAIEELPDTATAEEIEEAAPVAVEAARGLAIRFKDFASWSAAATKALGSRFGRFLGTLWNGMQALSAAAIITYVSVGPNTSRAPSAAEIGQLPVADAVSAAHILSAAAQVTEQASAPAERPVEEAKVQESAKPIEDQIAESLAKFDPTQSNYVQYTDSAFEEAILNSVELTPAMKAVAPLLGQMEGNAKDGPNHTLAKVFEVGGIRASQDEVPWCAMFVSHGFNKAGVPVRNVMAEQFRSFGRRTSAPKTGDVVVFNKRNEDNTLSRNTAGHVGFFIRESGDFVLVLDGNVGDRAAVTAMPKRRLIEYREAPGRVLNTRTVGYRPSRPRMPSQEELDNARLQRALEEEARRRQEAEDWEAFKAMSPEEQRRKEEQDREASQRRWEQAQEALDKEREQKSAVKADERRKDEERALAEAREVLARMPRPANPQDAEYIDAAVAGDVDRARSILDSAARSKGYPDTVFRGSEMDETTAYDRPVWVAVDRDLAEIYANGTTSDAPGYVRPLYFDKGESLELWKFRYWPEVVEYIASRGADPAKVERLKEAIARTLWSDQFDEGPRTWDNFAARYDRYREDQGEDDEDGGMLWDPDGGNIPSSWMTEDQGGRTANNRALVDTLFGFGFDSISQLEGSYDPADGATYVVRDSARLKSADLVTYDDEGNPVLPSQRFNDQVTDIRYTRTPAARVTPQMDSEYLAAVRSGDSTRIRELVDTAARINGFTGPFYHGSPVDNITEFNDERAKRGGVFITRSPEYAATYTSPDRRGDGTSGRVYALYARMTSTGREEDFSLVPGTYRVRREAERLSAIREAGHDSFSGTRLTDLAYITVEGKFDWPDSALDLARKSGKGSFPLLTYLPDGNTRIEFSRGAAAEIPAWRTIVLDSGKTILDEAPETLREPSEYGVFSPSQLKSADPVTYDESGNIVPLSQRFNDQVTDIRYTRTPAARLPVSLRPAPGSFEEDAVNSAYNAVTSGAPNGYTLADAPLDEITHLLNADVREAIAAADRKEKTRSGDTLSALENLARPYAYAIAGPAGVPTAPGTSGPLKAFSQTGLRLRSRIAASHGFLTPASLPYGDRMHDITEALTTLTELIGPERTVAYLTAVDPMKVPAGAQKARAQIHKHLPLVSRRTLARVFTGNTFTDSEQGIEYSVAPLKAEGVGIGRSVLWHELTGARAALEGFRDRETVALVEGGKILSVTRGTLEKPAEASDAEKQAWMTEHGAVEDDGTIKVRDAAGFVRVADGLYTFGEVTFADGPGLLAEGDVHEGVRYNTRRAGMGRKAFFSVKGAFLNYGRSMTPAEVRADYHERFLGIRTGVMGMVTQEGVWGKALYNIKKENEAGLAAVFTTVDRLERHLSRTKQGLAPQVVADVDMVLGTIDDVYDEAMRKAAVKARSEGRRAVLKAASAARKAASALVGDERKLRIREADKEQNDELARLETEYSDAMIAAAEKGRLAFLARRDQSIQRLKDGKYDDALKAALALRGHLDNLQGTIATRGGIDARVKAHFSARGGIHLTRSYQIHDDPHYARWIGSTDPVAVAKRQAALNWIRDNRKERFAKEFLAKNPTADAATVDAYASSATAAIPEYAILSELDQILDKHSRKGGTGVAGAMNASIFLERADVPKPIRELLGEYRDHTAAAVRTALEMGIYYANYRMFDDIKTKLEEHEAARVKRVDDLDKKERSKGLTPEEAKEFNDLKATRFFTTDDKEGVTHGLLQFSPDTRGLRSSAYGPLQGGYGPEVVVRAIQELNEAKNSNLAFDLYAKFLGQVMAAVTTRNLRGQARNFAASFPYVLASGMMNLALPVRRANDTDLPGLAGKIVKKAGALGGRRLKERIAAVGEREAFDEFFQLYASAGIIGGSERAAIMEDMRKMAGLDSDAMLQQAMERHFKKFSALPVGVANAATALKNLDKFAGDLYQGSDDYFKRLIFDMTYDNYLAAFGVPIVKGKAEYSDAQVDRIIEVYDGKGLLTPSSEKETEKDRKARADRLIVAAAAQATFSSIPFYNRLPEGLNWLQKNKLSAVFAPLTKYPAAVLQMPILLTRQVMFDMQTPETKALGIRRVVSTLAMFTAVSTITSTVVRAIIYALSMLPGGDDKLEVLAPSLVSGARERALKDLVTNPYYKNRDLSLIAMRGNNPVWVDLSYLNPFAVYSDMMAPLMSSRSRETMGDFQDAVAETVSTVPKMFFSPQLPIQEIYKIASDPTYDAQERRSTIGLGRDIAVGLGKMAVPLTFKDLAATGEAYGTSRFMPQLLSTGLGFKVQETDVAEALRSSLGKADKFEAETMDQVRRMLGSRKSVDPADLRAAYVKGLDNRRALLVELDRARKAAAMFFGDDAKARRIMFDSGRGLGQANVRALLDGHMRQWDPSAMTWERAAERGKDNADNRVETMRRLMRGTPEQIPLYESIEVK